MKNITKNDFDNLLALFVQIHERLEKIEQQIFSLNEPDTFLAEMNATNQEPEQVGEYEATMIVEAPPSIPDLSDIEPLPESTAKDEKEPLKPKGALLLNELADRMDLEKESETALMPEERFSKLCGYVISGHPSGLEVSAQWVTETLIKQGLAITSDQEKHLEMLRQARAAMLAKDMDLKQAQGQNGITENEKVALADLAKKNNLK